MPEICRFDGIIIRMFEPDHNPPHFHVLSKGGEAVISISPIALAEGKLDRKTIAKVFDWAANNQAALLENWHRLRNHQPPFKISPP